MDPEDWTRLWWDAAVVSSSSPPTAVEVAEAEAMTLSRARISMILEVKFGADEGARWPRGRREGVVVDGGKDDGGGGFLRSCSTFTPP